MNKVVILLRVLFAPFVILKGVLDHRHANNEHEWHECRCRPIKILQTRHQLKHGHEEEVGVGHLAKLFEEVLREEGGARILSRLNFIAHELAVMLVLLKLLIDLKDAPSSWFIVLLITTIG